MLTGEQVAALIVAVFWAILVCFIGFALLKLARLISETAKLVQGIGEQAGPLLDDMTRTVEKANEQLGRTDVITRQMAGVSQNVSAVTTVMTSVVGGPLVKAAAFSYGVRKALGQNKPGDRPELPPQRSASRGRGEVSGRGRR